MENYAMEIRRVAVIHHHHNSSIMFPLLLIVNFDFRVNSLIDSPLILKYVGILDTIGFGFLLENSQRYVFFDNKLRKVQKSFMLSWLNYNLLSKMAL